MDLHVLSSEGVASLVVTLLTLFVNLVQLSEFMTYVTRMIEVSIMLLEMFVITRHCIKRSLDAQPFFISQPSHSHILRLNYLNK